MDVLDLWHLTIGVVLLIFGRYLFWLFIGLAGYLFGVEFAQIAFAEQPQWVMISIAVGTGLLGALVAIVAERLAFGLGGFYGGAYLGVFLAHWLDLSAQNLPFFIAGGLLGAILAVFIMDWAIIFLSSLVGAGAIIRALDLPPVASALIYAGLVVVGVLIQGRIMRSSRTPGSP
jgi:Domain of unknown function (DUF4203)